MQNWDDIRYFLAVARTGSYLKASESLSVNASTVSRRIEQLEEKTQCQLFERLRHGMKLTALGVKLLDQAYAMEKNAQAMAFTFSENEEEQAGNVSISVTDGIGSVWLIPKLKSFYSSYPNISLNLKMEMSVADLHNREADIAIRTFKPEQNDLMVKKVGVVRFDVFSSPEYLDRFGSPKDWGDLTSHKIIDYQGYSDSQALKLWQEKVKNHDRVVLKTNSALAFTRALQNGSGIGMLPRFYRHAVTDLVPLELDTDLFEMVVYVVTHENVKNIKRVQLVKNHLIHLFEQDRKTWFS